MTATNWRSYNTRGDVLGANGLFQDAFFTDVRPLLAEMRTEMGLDPDPIGAYQRSGYQSRSSPNASVVPPPDGALSVSELRYEVPGAVDELLDRAHRLGADPRNTNYAGGNVSAKASVRDPASGREVVVMWVKGSGGDLGTLSFEGLAALRRDSLVNLTEIYRGLEHEDEMVSAFDYCLFGKGGAAPSIDTAMHGLVDCAHVDHLHPDSGSRWRLLLTGKRSLNDIR